MHPKERMHAQACTEELWKEKSNPKIVRRGPMCAGAHVHTHNTHTHTKRQLEVHPKGKSMMSSSSLPTSLTRFSHPLLAHLSPPSHHLLLVHLPPYQHIQGFQDRKKKCKKEKKAPTLALHQLLVSLCHKDRVKHLPDLSLNPGPWKPPPSHFATQQWELATEIICNQRLKGSESNTEMICNQTDTQENWIKYKTYLQSDMPKRIESNSNIICNQTPKENFIKYKHYLQSYTQGGIESNTSIICNQTPQGHLESKVISNQTPKNLNQKSSAIRHPREQELSWTAHYLQSHKNKKIPKNLSLFSLLKILWQEFIQTSSMYRTHFWAWIGSGGDGSSPPDIKVTKMEPLHK